MSAASSLLAALLCSCLRAQSDGQAPTFSSDSIVNAANGSTASLTPNGIATVYGVNLAYTTAALSLEDVGAGTLPNKLGGVQLTVGGIFAVLLYVSPTQINFLIPGALTPGSSSLSITRQATSAQAPT